MNIYVGNLNYRVKESDLQKAMEDYNDREFTKAFLKTEVKTM